MLRSAVVKQGSGRWNEISKQVFFESERAIFKSPKHCRERWLNHLDDSKKKGNWSVEEDLRILSYVVSNGKRWSKIVEVLSNSRT